MSTVHDVAVVAGFKITAATEAAVHVTDWLKRISLDEPKSREQANSLAALFRATASAFTDAAKGIDERLRAWEHGKP